MSIPFAFPQVARRSATSAIVLALVVFAASAITVPAVAAQDNPLAATVGEAAWDTTWVAAGVELRTVQFEHLLGLPQFVSVLEVDLDADGVSIDLVRPDSGRVKTSELASRAGAVAAVNGSYFEADGMPSLFLQDNGAVVRADDDGRVRFWEDGAIATEPDGDAVVVRRALPIWSSLPQFADVLVAGPLLVWDGQVEESEPVNFNLTHHPRTAVGITEENHLILVVADGRTIQSAGLTTHELALFMQALGCESALNLDGGGSTTMWTAGVGVVNHPSDNGEFDHEGERPVANVVVVRRANN